MFWILKEVVSDPETGRQNTLATLICFSFVCEGQIVVSFSLMDNPFKNSPKYFSPQNEQYLELPSYLLF